MVGEQYNMYTGGQVMIHKKAPGIYLRKYRPISFIPYFNLIPPTQSVVVT